jgi:hypothetical protein
MMLLLLILSNKIGKSFGDRQNCKGGGGEGA